VAAVRSAAMEGKGKKSEPWVEVVGVHSLPLAPGTLSGYVGVRLNNSKKRSWQAWVHIKGARSGAALVLLRTRQKPRWPGQLPSPVVLNRYRALGSRLRVSQVPLTATSRSHSLFVCFHHTFSLLCSYLMIMDSKTLSARGFHTAPDVRHERDLFWLAADGQRSKSAAKRAFAERIQLLISKHVEWRATCPATPARPAIAYRCGSHLHGRPMRAAGRVRCIWDRWARAGSVECTRATASYRTVSMWIMCG
jgi:hypothetical protein